MHSDDNNDGVEMWMWEKLKRDEVRFDCDHAFGGRFFLLQVDAVRSLSEWCVCRGFLRESVSDARRIKRQEKTLNDGKMNSRTCGRDV